MTVSTTSNRITYTGNGSTTVFAFPYKFIATADLVVYVGGVLQASGYTVGTPTDTGANVTFSVAPANLAAIVILSSPSQLQSTSLPSTGPFPAKAVETALDKATLLIQRASDLISRSLRLSDADSGTSNLTLPQLSNLKGAVLAFDETTGNPLVGPTIASVGTVAGNVANINTVAGSIANVNTTAGSIANVNAVGGNVATVVAVNANSANINAVNANATNINTVAGNNANVTTVAGISANVTTVAGNNANVTTVATNIASVNSAATNMAAIIAAPAQASAAAASAAAAAASAASGMYSAVQDKSGNYSVVAGDAGDLIRVTTTGGAVTITLPAISTQVDGFKIAVVKWTGDGNAVTVARSGSDTINGATSYNLANQYTCATFVADFETSQWFADASGIGTTNVVVDRFNGTGAQTAFTLAGSPGSLNNTYVFVGGVYQQKNTYTVSGTTLTFSAAPPSATGNIEVVWTQPLAIGTPSDGTVTTAKIADANVTPAKIAATGTFAFPDISYSGTLTGGTGVVNLGSGQFYKDASGNVGIGTSAPRSVASYTSVGVRGASGALLDLFDGSNRLATFGADAAGVSLASITAIPLTFGTANTERARIDSSGNLLVGTTSVFAKQTIAHDGSTAFGLACVNTAAGTTGQTAIRFMRNGSDVGSVTTTNIGTNFNTSSDYRLKKSVEPMQNALARNALLNPVRYKWKADGSEGEGFIAHELQGPFPGAVTGTKDAVDAEGKPIYQGIGTGPLDGHFAACINELTALIQEQQAIIQSLTQRIAALEGASEGAAK